jgi:hypothetical protein
MDDIEIPFNMGIYGMPRSGKTHLIKYIVTKFHKSFDSIIVMTGSTKGQYNFLYDLPVKEITILNIYKLDEKISLILKNQEKYKNKEDKIIHPILIIFDDIQGLFKSSKIISSINACYRHYDISIMFGFQNITSCKSEYRINQNYVFAFKMFSYNEISNLKDSFVFDMSLKELQEYLDKELGTVEELKNNQSKYIYKFLYINKLKGGRSILRAPAKITI